MELLIEFLKLLLPAALVLYAMYLTVKAFLNKDLEKKLAEIKIKNTEIILPIRLQAYERICLFLERISPSNLVLRLNDPAYKAKHFQQVLLSEIREEYTHNLSQQVYMSERAWNLVKKSMEDIVVIINQSGHDIGEDATGLDLAKAVFERILLNERDLTTDALKFLKDEIRQTF